MQNQSSGDNSDVTPQTQANGEVHVDKYEVTEDPGYEQVGVIILELHLHVHVHI